MKIKRVKKLAEKSFRFWVHWLGLGFWDVKMGFSKEKVDMGNGNFRGGLCEVSWEYLSAYITIYPKAIKHLDEGEIEKVVLHELMHVLVNEMREDGQLHEERVATQLEKAFLWVKRRN